MAIINDHEMELPTIDWDLEVCELASRRCVRVHLQRVCQLPDGMTYQRLQDDMRQTTEHLKELWKIQEEQAEIHHAVEKDETVLANRLGALIFAHACEIRRFPAAKLITFYHGLSELFAGDVEMNLLEVMHAMKACTYLLCVPNA